MDCSCEPLSRHFRRRESGVATVAWRVRGTNRGNCEQIHQPHL
jgi:hypothetical protein